MRGAVGTTGDAFRHLGVAYKVDDSSAAIGRRYARCEPPRPPLLGWLFPRVLMTPPLSCRADELGIPFGITIDFQSLKDDSATLRERDTTKPQVRVAVRTRAWQRGKGAKQCCRRLMGVGLASDQ
jgi:glycyl-tRNA synthetase